MWTFLIRRNDIEANQRLGWKFQKFKIIGTDIGKSGSDPVLSFVGKTNSKTLFPKAGQDKAVNSCVFNGLFCF